MAHILVFDSGVGGLSVVDEIRALMPGAHLSYVADDAFRPYGNKTEAQLKARLPGLMKTLVLMCQPDIVVLACNTASTAALKEVRVALDIPVIGVVPAVKPAAANSQSKTIAVLGTPGTVRRRYVGGLIKNFAKDCHVILHGSTKLVEAAETKLAGGDVDLKEIAAELQPMFQQDGADKIDHIVLACTHFPLLIDELKSVSPSSIKWISSGPAVARRTGAVLAKNGRSSRPGMPQTAFLVGGQDDPARPKIFGAYGFVKTVVLPA